VLTALGAGRRTSRSSTTGRRTSPPPPALGLRALLFTDPATLAADLDLQGDA
jgi:hypothetical protein